MPKGFFWVGIFRLSNEIKSTKNVDSTLEQYEFVHSDMMRSSGVDKYARVAALVRTNDSSHDFLETVFRNVGFNLRLFRDRGAALNFLNG